MGKKGFFVFMVFGALTFILNSPSESSVDLQKRLRSKIKKVIVFTDRAQVLREGTIKLTPGKHTLYFDNLPNSIEEKSIQVSGVGSAALLDISLQKVFFSKITDKEVKRLHDEKKRMEDALRVLSDKIKTASEEGSFLNKIVSKVTGVTEKSDRIDLDSVKWAKMIDFYRLTRHRLDKEILELEKKKRGVKDELDKVRKEIVNAGFQNRKEKKQVQVVVQMKESGPLTLNLSYIVYGPRWYPIYDFRVDSNKEKLNLAYYAQVQQNTQEDWNDITLTLSTAKPNIRGKEPELSPWRISLYFPQIEKSAGWGYSDRGRDNYKLEAIPEVMEFGDRVFRDEDVRGLKEESSQLISPKALTQDKVSSMTFKIDGRTTIKSDNEPHKIVITQETLPATFRYSSVPKLNEYVYLKAEVMNNTEYPLLSGEVNVFLDNSFITSSSIDFIAPKEKFEASLGIDEGISIEYKLLKRYIEETGVFTEKIKTIYDYLITVKNNKKREVELSVHDQLPISGSEGLKVGLIEPKYEKDTDALKKNNLNFFEWTLKLKPKAEEKIPFKFFVEYSKDREVKGLE